MEFLHLGLKIRFCNFRENPGSKYKKAMELGIELVTEDEIKIFLEYDQK